jgi:hypothetical protein
MPARESLTESGTIAEVPYGELEHVTVTRDFLNDPLRFIPRGDGGRGSE